MTDSDYLERAFDRAADDVRRVVRDVAGRYARRGVPLTWRVLHAIEEEALADLGLASRLGAEWLASFSRPPEADYPRTDALVKFDDATTTPLIFWFALEAYGATGRAVPVSMRSRMQGAPTATPQAVNHVRSL